MRLHRASWIVRAALIAAAAFAATPAAAADGMRSADVTVTRRVVVSIADRKLAVLENDRIISIYPVAVGAPVSPSPIGTFSVINRVDESDVLHARQGREAGQPAIRLARDDRSQRERLRDPRHRSARLDRLRESHGCIRLSNEDVERLFEQLRAGDVVELHAERTPELASSLTPDNGGAIIRGRGCDGRHSPNAARAGWLFLPAVGATTVFGQPSLRLFGAGAGGEDRGGGAEAAVRSRPLSPRSADEAPGPASGAQRSRGCCPRVVFASTRSRARRPG